jgi:hypothetical protein
MLLHFPGSFSGSIVGDAACRRWLFFADARSWFAAKPYTAEQLRSQAVIALPAGTYQSLHASGEVVANVKPNGYVSNVLQNGFSGTVERSFR